MPDKLASFIYVTDENNNKIFWIMILFTQSPPEKFIFHVKTLPSKLSAQSFKQWSKKIFVCIFCVRFHFSYSKRPG